MPSEQIIYLIIMIALALIIYFQNRRIKQLENRINTLAKTANKGEDERLIYLKGNLSHLDQVQAIKALRERYPELSLVEANDLWLQQ